MSAAAVWTARARDTDLLKNARIANLPRVTVDSEPTVMRMCARCGTQSPHLMRHAVCILCEMDDEPIPRVENEHYE